MICADATIRFPQHDALQVEPCSHRTFRPIAGEFSGLPRFAMAVFHYRRYNGLIARAASSGVMPWRVRTRSHLGAARFGLRASGAVQTKNQRLHSPRILQREFLRDHSAHRHAIEVRALDSRRVEHGGGIRSHRRDRIRTRGYIASPGASIIECNRSALPVSRGFVRYHIYDGQPRPMISRTGAPWPSSSQ